MNRLIARIWHLMRGTAQWRVLWLAHAKFMIGVTGIVRDHDGQAPVRRASGRSAGPSRRNSIPHVVTSTPRVSDLLAGLTGGDIPEAEHHPLGAAQVEVGLVGQARLVEFRIFDPGGDRPQCDRGL